MAMHNPMGRVNYEPNSYGGADGGPREDPKRGFKSLPVSDEGPKRRVRAELFADHYSQARQFYISQTPIEQKHIAQALVFELGKVERQDIRERVVSHLRNIDEDLAKSVSTGLRLPKQPRAAKPAREPLDDLPPSDALSILKNGPKDFAGRRIGALVCDGVDAALLKSLRKETEAAGAELCIVAPHVGGIKASDGSHVPADAQLDGGPSVLFDAVAVLLSDGGAKSLLTEPAARDFVADAFSHYKFIAYNAAALALFDKAGLPRRLDDGFVALDEKDAAKSFLQKCTELRYWERSGA
jgi:catalase